METANEPNGLNGTYRPVYLVDMSKEKERVTYFDGKASVSIGTHWIECNLTLSFPNGWSALWRSAWRAAAAILWHQCGSVDMVKRMATPLMVERMIRKDELVALYASDLDAWLERKALTVHLQNELRLPAPPCHPGEPSVG